MRNKRLINYVKELFRNDVMGARVECGDLPKLVVEYLIARYFERWDAQLTPTRVMKLLAAALFINPPSTGGDIDIHELAYCFGYRIYKYPVYSQVVMESLNELRREGGRIATKSVLDIDVRVLIRKGRNWRGGEEILKDLRRGQYGEWEGGLIERIDDVVKKYGSWSARELKKYLYDVFAMTPSLIGSGHDLVKYLEIVKRAREVGKSIPEDRLYTLEL